MPTEACIGKTVAAQAAPLKGMNIATYHKTWSYFAKRYGLNVVGVVEPKPGIEPTPSDIRRLILAIFPNIRVL